MHPLFSQGLSYQIFEEVPQAMMMAFVKHVKVGGVITQFLPFGHLQQIQETRFCFVLFCFVLRGSRCNGPSVESALF
jgi:hypothetical protein